MSQRSETHTQNTWDNEHEPFLKYWRLLLMTDEGYAKGVESIKKRTSLVDVDLPKLHHENEQEELRMILKNFPNTDLYLKLLKGKDRLFAVSTSIALKHGMNQQQTIDPVYEGSRPANLQDVWQGEVFWREGKTWKKKELKQIERGDRARVEVCNDWTTSSYSGNQIMYAFIRPVIDESIGYRRS
ncbi:hypothetical protein G6011_01507 [Alternaria panax]|uniref:Uncharacterized protein n=1 Tax=Alternaria panax TaxID=48097 RepID=A0AAD4NUL6_9PLEO|nr:hypothetical protein G6011_01507 [Alternaria panax]